jgi:hypothetical protein
MWKEIWRDVWADVLQNWKWKLFIVVLASVTFTLVMIELGYKPPYWWSPSWR